MKLSIKSTVNCFHCGKQLSLFHRLRDSQYCSEAHRDAHSEEINKLNVARLCGAEKSSAELRWEQCERRMMVKDPREDLSARALTGTLVSSADQN